MSSEAPKSASLLNVDAIRTAASRFYAAVTLVLVALNIAVALVSGRSSCGYGDAIDPRGGGDARRDAALRD